MSELKAAFLTERGVVRVSGPEARSFLQGLITNNVDLVAPGRAIYAGLLTPHGKFLFDFFIAVDDSAEDALLLDCDGGRAADLVKRLGFYRLRAKVTLEDITSTRQLVAFWGGQPLAEAASTGVLFADPRLPAMGSRLITMAADKAIKASGALKVPDTDYHHHRIELGVGDAAQDFEPDRSFPLEMNFDELHGVDFKKGCFIGQEVTSRTKRRGSVRKRLLPCLVEGAIPKHGTPVRAGMREVGTVFSSDGRGGRVMALLRLDLIHGATLEAGDAGLKVEKPVWAQFDTDGMEEDDGDVA